MQHVTKNHWYIFFQLIKAELKAYKPMALSETIDLLVWVAVLTVINGLVLPALHVPREFLLISFSGTVASAVSFKSYPNIANLVADVHGDQTIKQRLILPIPPWMGFFAMVVSTFLITLWTALWAFPLGLPFMWQLMDFSGISLWRFLVIMLASAWFFSALPLLMTSFIPSPRLVGRVWLRFLFPLWFFGGFSFTWEKFYEAIPWLAIIDLMNPYLYMMEGARVALLGPPGNLPFWLDVSMLLVLSIICFVFGVKRLRKQIDAV
ncbi:MAG TPA: ABC transporter permease [Myxococcota bacterium]|nr:ABC transporter permease [Myxococcota bacterium]